MTHESMVQPDMDLGHKMLLVCLKRQLISSNKEIAHSNLTRRVSAPFCLIAIAVISSGLDKQQTTTEFNQPYDIIKGGTGSQKYQI